MNGRINVLDHGFVRLVETWGQGDAGVLEAGFVEAARQSTQGTYRGMEPGLLPDGEPHPGDRRLLSYMWRNQHNTPFEFGGMVIEVRAPIFVFRQTIRHRLIGVNELSARYGQVPSHWYIPTLERVMAGALPTDNRQASAMGEPLTEDGARWYLDRLREECAEFERVYAIALDRGVPKELARLGMPVTWFSQQRMICNVRGWFHFLALRLDEHAQWETRQFAEAIASIVAEQFPESWALFDSERRKVVAREANMRELRAVLKDMRPALRPAEGTNLGRLLRAASAVAGVPYDV